MPLVRYVSPMMLGRHSKPFLQIAGTLLALLLSQSATAQQITVKLVDGRNGHALKNQSIGLWLGHRAIGNPAITRITSSDGSAVFPVPHEQQSFVIAGFGLVDCRPVKSTDKSTGEYEADVYRFTYVLTHGVVAENKCGKAVVQALPGQLILFERPPHWWEKVLWE
jgi:hypothetical protein